MSKDIQLDYRNHTSASNYRNHIFLRLDIKLDQQILEQCFIQGKSDK